MENLIYQGVRDLGNGWWLFVQGRDWTFKVCVQYEETSLAEKVASTVRDLWLPTDHAISPWEFRFSLRDFLHQFYSLSHRWGGQYEPFTEDIIYWSAQWQESYFLRSTLMPTHTRGEATIVAAALRCLVISNEINQVGMNWSTRFFRRKDERYARLADVERSQDQGIRPSVKVWRLERGTQLPDSVPQDRESFPQMLKRIFHMARLLLYRGRPQDWPSLFYVICILALVRGGTNYQFWTKAADRAAREIWGALQELCRLFFLTTGNMQPLNSNLDLERYAVLADDNELAVEHYRRMHHLWLANRESTRGAQMSYPDKASSDVVYRSR